MQIPSSSSSSSSYLYIYFPSVLGIRLFAAQFDQHHLISTLQVLFWSLEFFLHHRFDDDDDDENPKCEFGIGILFCSNNFFLFGSLKIQTENKNNSCLLPDCKNCNCFSSSRFAEKSSST